MKTNPFSLPFRLCGQARIKALVLICFFLLPLLCFAAVITVPGDYSTIQAAINAARDGDEIIVSPGTYVENIDIGRKNIILRSTEPANPVVVANTIIDGNQAGSVVTFSGIESSACVLSGFFITNGSAYHGGGIYGNGTFATMANNMISSNSASQNGGGIYWCHGAIRNNAICSNSAANGAGLFRCRGAIENNAISNNSANHTGGALNECHGSVNNNTISGNSASWSGGGLFYCYGTIRNNIISENSALNGGGLAYCDGSIDNNTVSHNSASDHGGGLLSCYGDIRNNIISWNSSSDSSGGGLYDCLYRIINNTIWDNSAPLSGGGLSNCAGEIRNCIIWNNTASTDAQIHNSSIPWYSCIQDWTDGGIGNINSSPQLVNPNNGDFHLQSHSPCIDAGCYLLDVSVDFEGDPRPYDGTSEPRGDGSDFDIGADEYHAPIAPPYSFNFDTGPEGWVFGGIIGQFDSPAQTSAGGHLGLSPGGSSFCFGFWNSPEILVQNGATYRAEFSLSSSLSTGELVSACRLRVNQMNGYGSVARYIISGGDGGGAPVTTPRSYDLLFTPLLSGADGTVTLSFDILNFGPFDDANAWLYLEFVTIEEVSVSP